MVRVTIRVVGRVCLFHRAVGELICGVWEDRIPPIEEFMRVTFLANRIVACADAGGYCF